VAGETSAGRMDDNPLSGRQIEVLKMAGRGMTNARIADALRVSVATVKRRLANSYGKLGVGARGEAVGRGLAEGWIGPWDLLPPGEAGAGEHGAGSRYRCADGFCGCEVVVVRRPTLARAASWRAPECHGSAMVRVGPRG
jgi:DNA-binding CsgD family transcriptional regulator